MVALLVLPFLAAGFTIVRDHDGTKRHVGISVNGELSHKQKQGPDADDEIKAMGSKSEESETQKEDLKSDSTKTSASTAAASEASMVQAKGAVKSVASKGKADPDPAGDAADAKADADKTDVAAGAEKEVEKVEKKAEEEVEKVVDTAAEDSAAAVEGVAKEAITDVEQVKKDLTSGPGGEAEEAVREAALDTDPCESFGDCVHVIAMNTVVFVLGLLVYVSYLFDQRKTGIDQETPLTKSDFTGNMEPVKMGPCPGGFLSTFCCMSYFCVCCLRVELLGKLEKWDSAKTKMNMYMFVAIVMLGHVVIVSTTIFLKFDKKYVHAAGMLSLPIAWIGIAALGYKMAQWRIVLKQKKGVEAEAADSAPPGACGEMIASTCCAPCAGGQEAEFMEKYEDTFGKTEW